MPVMPETAAHSLAIGAPGDGYLVIDAVHKRGGTAAFASDPEIFAGIDLLAATEGLLTEPAGGTTIAVLEKLAAAGRFGPDETVVAMITGNGMKTLDEHPPKPWPAKVDCERDAMIGGPRRAEEHREADGRGAPPAPALRRRDGRIRPRARRREERRAVEEAGGGESEGFELAEQELIEHTSHGDEHSPFRIIADGNQETPRTRPTKASSTASPTRSILPDRSALCRALTGVRTETAVPATMPVRR